MEEALHGRNLTVVIGDFLDTNAFWETRSQTWRTMTRFAQTRLIDTSAMHRGHSHMLMSDNGSEALLHTVMEHDRTHPH